MLALVIAPYNDPDPAVRRRNVLRMHGMCRWALDHGYHPVCSVIHAALPEDAPEDVPGLRERVLAYSAELARMVGKAGGVAIVAGWAHTNGMRLDGNAYYEAAEHTRLGGTIRRVTLAEIEPYMPWGGTPCRINPIKSRPSPSLTGTRAKWRTRCDGWGGPSGR